MDQKATGQFILELRKEKGFTQKQLADAIGVSDKAVSKWETGNGMPDTGLLLPLCNTLDITVNELLSATRLQEEEYSLRAENNIIQLLNENRKADIFSILKAILGFALIIGCLFLELYGNSDAFWYIDIPSLIGLVAACAAVVLIAGCRDKNSIIGLARKTVLPIGIGLTLCNLISMLGSISDLEKFGRNLNAALLTLLYSIVCYIILVVLDRKFNPKQNTD